MPHKAFTERGYSKHTHTQTHKHRYTHVHLSNGFLKNVPQLQRGNPHRESICFLLQSYTFLKTPWTSAVAMDTPRFPPSYSHFSSVSSFFWKACNRYGLVNAPATYQNMLFPACKHVLKSLRKCVCLCV